MNKTDSTLWNNLTFKTQNYRKNYDLINLNENFITECDGTISQIRIDERKPPHTVGEYGLSVWNIELGKQFKVNFNDLLKDHAFEDTYGELIDVIRMKKINISDYKKIVLVHNLIIHKDYRNRGVTEELTEMLYRDYYGDNVAVIILVKPFQNNPIDADYYLNHKQIIIRETIKDKDNTVVPAKEYYSLKELMSVDDTEMIEYKLFAIANRCGFSRINNSYLFIFTQDKTIERMKIKYLENKNNFIE